MQRSIFDDIAREGINFCRWSLTSGANRILAKGTPTSQVDSQLFLIRHLLVLKDLIVALDLSGGESDGPLEFRHVTGVFPSCSAYDCTLNGLNKKR